MPRIWLLYLSLFSHPLCPPHISYTHARRTYDRALRTLPPSLHSRIWPLYLLWAESKGGDSTVRVYSRYLRIDPSVTERYTALLLSEENGPPRPLQAAKLLISLARSAARGEYTSPEGKSPYQLLGDWLDVVEKFAEEVGLDGDEADVAAAARQKKAEEEAMTKKAVAEEEPASVHGKLIRFAGPPVAAIPTTKDAKSARPYDPDEDPIHPAHLDIEKIVKEDGLAVYKDQSGRLWTGLATYWTKRGDFDRVSFSSPSHSHY